MELIWRTEKMVDERGVIVAIEWELTAHHGARVISKRGRAELPPPDEGAVAYDQERRKSSLDGGADRPGYMRAEWVERRELHPWLFAIIDKDTEEEALRAELARS